MTAEKQRATLHNGRKGDNGKPIKAVHNDHDFEAEHINAEKTSQNKRWLFQEVDVEEGKDFQNRYEQAVYEKMFSDYLEKRNATMLRGRHKERVQTMEQFRVNPRACPEESIISIGNAKNQVAADDLASIYNEYAEWHQQTFPNVILLSSYMHLDEASPHIHERKVWTAHDGDTLIINQEKALAEMGVERPDTSKKVGRKNNAKMTYTKMCREKLIEIARSHGIEIEDVPRDPSKSGMKLMRYKYEKLKEDCEEMQTKVNLLTERAEVAERALLNLLDGIPSLELEELPIKPDEPKKPFTIVQGYPDEVKMQNKANKEWEKAHRLWEKKELPQWERDCSEIMARNEQRQAEWDSKYLTADNLAKARKQIEQDKQKVEPIIESARSIHKQAAAEKRKAEETRKKIEQELIEQAQNVQRAAQELSKQREQELFGTDGKSRTKRLERFCEGIVFPDNETALDKFNKQEQRLRSKFNFNNESEESL